MRKLDEAVPPILVHCTSGTHRTGVVAAIWLIHKEGLLPEKAVGQLSSKFGFFYPERALKSLVQGQPTIDSIVWSYLHANEHQRIAFRDWIRSGMPHYPPKTVGSMSALRGR